MANRNTVIRAVADGTVLDYSEFYEGTWELVVQHRPEGMAPFIVRYGEVLGPEAGSSWGNGQSVVAGADIAHVGQLNSGASMLHFELYASTQWPFPSLSMANRWRRAPNSYSAEDITAIQAEGYWHWDFQRRVDLADPTDFLLALRDGQSPSQPIALNQDPGITMDALRVAPSEEYYRRQREIERERQEQQIRAYVEDYQRVHGSRLRMPGPNLDLEASVRRGMEGDRRQWIESQRQIQIRDILQTRGPHGIDPEDREPNIDTVDYSRHGPI